MPSRLHEGMTRNTQSKSATPRAAYLTLAALALLLALGWAAVSLTGASDTRQAQAQTPGPDGGAGDGGPADWREDPSYESYGERKNPFIQVASEVSTVGEDQNGGDRKATPPPAGNGGNGAPAGAETTIPDDAPAAAPNGAAPNGASASNSGSQSSQTSPGTGSAPQPQQAPPGSGAATAQAGSAGCQGIEDEFEKQLCEDAAADSTTSQSSGSAQPGSAQPGSGDDRYGGSGRSGAGAPTESFRNGGAAGGK